MDHFFFHWLIQSLKYSIQEKVKPQTPVKFTLAVSEKRKQISWKTEVCKPGELGRFLQLVLSWPRGMNEVTGVDRCEEEKGLKNPQPL